MFTQRLWVLVISASIIGCGARIGRVLEEEEDTSEVRDTGADSLEPEDSGSSEDGGPDVIIDDEALPLLEVGSRVEVGPHHTCMIDDDLEVLCWGDNFHGDVGDGTRGSRPSPYHVEGVSDVVQLGLGHTFSCALHTDGTVSCWGAVGQMWPEEPFEHRIPWGVEGLNGVVSIGSGFGHICAVRLDGSVWCWGGYGWTTHDDINCSSDGLRGPTRIEGLGRAVQVEGGTGHSCALLEDGTVWCWGCNSRGQLGDGTENDSISPVQVGGLDEVVLIAMEHSSSCAVDADGDLWCWGLNWGNLADGTDIDRATPVRALGETGAIEAIEISGTTLCVLSSGRILCSGSLPAEMDYGCRNTFGSWTLEPYTGLDRVVDLATSGWHYCALSEDDTVRCWGCNSDGQVGDGSYQYREAPWVVWPLHGS